MSLHNIKTAFESEIASITPTLATQYDNVSFTPTSGVPYQSLSTIFANNEAQYINEVNYLVKGFYQINLYYPTLNGEKQINDRVQLYMDYFTFGKTLNKNGTKINLLNVPDVIKLGVIGDRYVVSIRMNFKCLL